MRGKSCVHTFHVKTREKKKKNFRFQGPSTAKTETDTDKLNKQGKISDLSFNVIGNQGAECQAPLSPGKEEEDKKKWCGVGPEM